MKKANHTDVAIIGGGIMGSAIAYYASKAGLDCMLIEKNDIASGTSSRCDGNVTIVDKDTGLDSQMSLASQKISIEVNKDLKLRIEYSELGSILVCDNNNAMEAAEDWVKIQKDAGLKFNALDREDI